MLKLNVSLSKKVGLPEFGSIGASCSVKAEMNNGLLQHDPTPSKRFGVDQAGDLSITEASALIDELKGPQTNGNGAKR